MYIYILIYGNFSVSRFLVVLLFISDIKHSSQYYTEKLRVKLFLIVYYTLLYKLENLNTL